MEGACRKWLWWSVRVAGGRCLLEVAMVECERVAGHTIKKKSCPSGHITLLLFILV